MDNTESMLLTETCVNSTMKQEPKQSDGNAIVKGNEDIPDWMLARQGMKLLINNDSESAKEIFLRNKDSLVLYSGYAISVFMDALMTLEDDKLSLAITTLKDLEKRCAADTGWLKSVKCRVFGTVPEEQRTLAETLETQIILADSLVCLAILTFMQQELTGYFKGSWVLRKSWKIYQSVYNEILLLYKNVVGEFELPDSLSVKLSPELDQVDIVNEDKGSTFSDSSDNISNVRSQISNGSKMQEIDKDTVIRLMGAVTFGYGLFQLGISLLPPSLLKFTNLLGFSGSRKNGTACLMYARLGVDMRAPLATLSLLWYYTIVRPFYALDGTNIKAGVDYAQKLIEESHPEYDQSALFLFFKGRVCRLQSDIPGAIESFQASLNEAQREIKNLCLHEVGWCYLIQLDFKAAGSTFADLKHFSRWSISFYTYLSAICLGSNADCTEAIEEFVALAKREGKGNQLEEFLSRRGVFCSSDKWMLRELHHGFWRLLVYEMLYLWNALPSCNRASINYIIQDCLSIDTNDVDSEPMLALSKLLLGCAYCMRDEFSRAIESFRECLRVRKDIAVNAPDAHVSAFSQYELGALLIKSPETKEEGKQLLIDLSQYKDYDFEQRLTVRVHSMLKNL